MRWLDQYIDTHTQNAHIIKLQFNVNCCVFFSFFLSFGFALAFQQQKQRKKKHHTYDNIEMNRLKMDVLHTSKFNIITSSQAQIQSPPAR